MVHTNFSLSRIDVPPKTEEIQTMVDLLKKNTKVIAVIRAPSKELALEAAQAIYLGGIRCLEITFTVPEAEWVIYQLRLKFSDAHVGAGSITQPAQGEKALAAGAEFCVSPHLDINLIRWFRNKNAPYIPGACTPSELMTGWNEGCEVLKLFPASVWGPEGMKTILQPLPFLNLIITGGVDEKSAPRFLEGGAMSICVGSQLLTREILEKRNWEQLKEEATRWTGVVS